MYSDLVRNIVKELRNDLKTLGEFREETIEKVKVLEIKDSEDVARLYGFKKCDLNGGGSQLAGYLKYLNRNSSRVLELNNLTNLYFRTGHRMYLEDNKLCLSCPLEQKIRMVEVTSSTSIADGVNELLKFVREACPKQQWYCDDADKILLFERNVERMLK
ncbi:hypothetical protein UT300012_23470 [Paraclostridium bifermentans]